jgi:hypothetical protein
MENPGLQQALKQQWKSNKESRFLLLIHAKTGRLGRSGGLLHGLPELSVSLTKQMRLRSQRRSEKQTRRRYRRLQDCSNRSFTLRRQRLERRRRRRRSGIEGRLQSAKLLTNARQKERARSKSTTLKKLYKHRQKVRERLQKLQQGLRRVPAVLWMMWVVTLPHP